MAMITLVDLSEIENMLRSTSVIAVVGLSPKKKRPSNIVARYLNHVGFTVIPVNPGHDSILGVPCYPSLLDIPQSIDLVNIFRKSETVEPIVRQAMEIGCRAIWMQQGVINHFAAELARQNGCKVVMDRCIKIDHANLIANN